MVEELKAVLERISASAGRIGQDDHYAAIFLRDHGQALLEAVADAERYRWLMDNATIEAPFGAVSMKTVPPDEPGHAKILWDAAIATARSKTVDGGGA